MQSVETTPDAEKLNFSLAGKIVLLLGMTTSSYGLFGLLPVLPAIAAHFAQEPNAGLMTRMIISVGSIVVAVTSPIMGAIADRFGARRVLLIGLAVYAIAGCAPFFLDDLRAILTTRAVMGVAIAAQGTVILVTLVQSSTESVRDRWLGYLVTTATILAIFYPPLVGYIGRFGWHWPFLTYAVGLLLLLLAIVGIDPDRPRVAEHKGKSDSKTSGRISLGTPLTHIVFVLIAGTLILSPPVYIPFRLHEMGITDSGAIGVLMMPTPISGAIASLSFGWIRSRLSMQATFAVAFSGLAAGLLVIATATGTPQIIVGQLLIGFATGMNMPNIFVLASVVGADAYRARTIGFTKGGIYGGPMIAQILLEPVIARTDFKFVLCLFSLGAAMLALLYAWRLMSRRPVPA